MSYADTIYARLSQEYPEAEIEVIDPDGVHLTLKMKEKSFSSLTKMQQHRAIYKALGDVFAQGLHALEIHSSAS